MASADLLDVSGLGYPMLTDFLSSPEMYADMQAVGEAIRAGWVDRVAKDTGRLASTGQVRMIKGGRRHDRWEADFTAGGEDAPYAPMIEARDHALAETLAALGLR